MSNQTNVLGIMKPLGGGDPIPLLKDELIVGRRPSCDVCLDFSNVSGKHCVLRLINNVWHVRDLGSTNGTSINGATLNSEHTLMPEDELGIANHMFTIDYEPAGPEAVVHMNEVIEQDLVEKRRRHSLVELAGLDTDDNKPRRKSRPDRAPAVIERASVDEVEFDDALPEHARNAPVPEPEINDEDFLKAIEEDLKKSDP